MRYVIGLTLTGLGVFALAAGAFVRLYVAPSLVVAPTDIYQVTRLSADNARYFDGGTLRMRTGVTLTATNTIRGDVAASRGDIAVWDTTTVVEDLGNKSTVDINQHRLAFDRRTGRLTGCCGAAAGSGAGRPSIGLFWPVGVERKEYRLFDTPSGRAWPITYDGTDQVDGVSTYRYTQVVPATKLPDKLPEVPGNLLGLTGKAAVPVDRYYEAQVTYWIDPRTGVPLDVRQQVLSTLRAKSGPGRLVVADMNLRMTPVSQKLLRDTSEDTAGKLLLLRLIVPVACVLGGLTVVVVGLLLARRNRGTRRRRPAEPTFTYIG